MAVLAPWGRRSARRAPRGVYASQMAEANLYTCWNGRLLTSKDAPYAIVVTSVLIVAFPACWLAWEAPYLSDAVSIAPVVLFVYFWLSAMAHMMYVCDSFTDASVTAFTDPGIVPRHLDPSPERETASSSAPFAIEAPVFEAKDKLIPLERVDDGGDASLGTMTTIVSKWCTTCRTYRPPRCSHCRSCDMCVDGLDHHCIFLNACVGRRNYTSFYAFLCHALGLFFVGLVGCIVKLYYLAAPRTPAQARPRGTSQRGFVHALQKSPESAVFFLLGVIWLTPVLCLWTYHTWLLCQNRSTVEQIRLETTDHMYDVQRVPGTAWEHTAVARACAHVSARVRNLVVPADFATPLDAPSDAPVRRRPPRRTRGPYQHANLLRNAWQVLGRPTPATHKF